MLSCQVLCVGLAPAALFFATSAWTSGRFRGVCGFWGTVGRSVFSFYAGKVMAAGELSACQCAPDKGGGIALRLFPNIRRYRIVERMILADPKTLLQQHSRRPCCSSTRAAGFPAGSPFCQKNTLLREGRFRNGKCDSGRMMSFLCPITEDRAEEGDNPRSRDGTRVSRSWEQTKTQREEAREKDGKRMIVDGPSAAGIPVPLGWFPCPIFLTIPS